MTTRTITLTMPEDLIRRTKVVAAQRATSVSALVAELLTSLTGPIDDYAQTWADEERLMADGIGMRVGEISWTRDDLHR